MSTAVAQILIDRARYFGTEYPPIPFGGSGGVVDGQVDDSTGNIHWVNGSRKVAIDSTGRIYVAYTNAANAIKVRYTEDGAQTWSAEEAVDGGDRPTIAIDSNDDLHLAYCDTDGEWKPYYRKRTKSTGTWGAQEEPASSATDAGNPAIAVDGSDNVHLVWQGKGYGTQTTYQNIHYNKRTTSWGTVEAVTDINSSYSQTQPSLSVDSTGDCHCVWYGNGTGTYPGTVDVSYAKRNGSWGSAELVTDEDYACAGCCITLDADDHVHVAYQKSISSTYQLFHREKTGSWQAEDELTSGGSAKLNPQIAVDLQGDIDIVYEDTASFTVIKRIRWTGSWGAGVTIASGASKHMGYPMLLENNNPVIGKVYAGIWMTYMYDDTGDKITRFYRSADLNLKAITDCLWGVSQALDTISNLVATTIKYSVRKDKSAVIILTEVTYDSAYFIEAADWTTLVGFIETQLATVSNLTYFDVYLDNSVTDATPIT